MTHPARTTALILTAVLLAGAPTASGRHRRPSRKSPHTQIAALCRVETAPEEKVHSNERRFLEFDVTIVSYERLRGDAQADPEVAVKTGSRVHIVHDLTCGGERVSLAVGDAAEIKGEYVAVPNGRDLIHFTHPADGSCGTKGGHPGGSIRRLDPSALRKAA